METINIKFYPVVTIKGKKPEDDKEIPYEASVKVCGVKDELYYFFQWLISYIISHCARKLGKPIYRIELEDTLNEDISQTIREHYDDIIEYDINQVSLEFKTPTPNDTVNFILNDLNDKLQRNTYVRNVLQQEFYDIRKGCNRYSRARLLGREDDISTIMEIFKNPNNWYMFRGWKSPHDKYYVD